MIFIITSISLLVFLLSLLFAGTKGRDIAKKKWTIFIVILFIIFSLILLSTSKKGDQIFFMAIILITIGTPVTYILNKIGKWLIDFVVFNIMSDNRDRIVKGYDPPWK